MVKLPNCLSIVSKFLVVNLLPWVDLSKIWVFFSIFSSCKVLVGLRLLWVHYLKQQFSKSKLQTTIITAQLFNQVYRWKLPKQASLFSLDDFEQSGAIGINSLHALASEAIFAYSFMARSQLQQKQRELHKSCLHKLTRLNILNDTI